MAFEKLGITLLNHNKDDIQFVTEFPCLLGHPVYKLCTYLKPCSVTKSYALKYNHRSENYLETY